MSGRAVQPGVLEVFLFHTLTPKGEWVGAQGGYDDTIYSLLANDLLERYDGRFLRATERGWAYLELLCQTPLPINPFIDPRDRKEVLRERQPDEVYRVQVSTGMSENGIG